MSHREKEGRGKKLRVRKCGKTDTDRKVSLSDDLCKVEISEEENEDSNPKTLALIHL
jgi:hypothetical protein